MSVYFSGIITTANLPKVFNSTEPSFYGKVEPQKGINTTNTSKKESVWFYEKELVKYSIEMEY